MSCTYMALNSAAATKNFDWVRTKGHESNSKPSFGYHYDISFWLECFIP